jgi:hypothetical protein
VGGASPENRETERQKRQRLRVAEATEESEERPLLAARVTTLQAAVQTSLAEGLTENVLFRLARALKAFELTTRIRLSPDECAKASALWWNTARPLLPTDADFDEWRFAFEHAMQRARTPLGSNLLAEALRRVDAGLLPPSAGRYSSPKLKRLVGLCYHLQDLAGDAPFFLSLRDAKQVSGCSTLYEASALMNGLVRDGVLSVVTKGTPGGRRATRYRFNRSSASISPSGGMTQAANR